MLIRIAAQATADQARAKLERLAAERREDFAGPSRLFDRPTGYLSRYVRQGRLHLLQGRKQRVLANYIGIQPQELGAPIGDE